VGRLSCREALCGDGGDQRASSECRGESGPFLRVSKSRGGPRKGQCRGCTRWRCQFGCWGKAATAVAGAEKVRSVAPSRHAGPRPPDSNRGASGEGPVRALHALHVAPRRC
jgi:hypothetical protein